MEITTGELSNPQVTELLLTHLALARAETASGSAHALNLEELHSPMIKLWTIWEAEELLGCGALLRLSRDHGEVKSMHTVKLWRGRGIGSAMLRHIITAAREDGMSRLSLQTSSWAFFKPAVALYKRHGFAECPPFADYMEDSNSIFLSLELKRP